MNRLEKAKARFLAALDALETSVNERLASAHESVNSKTEATLLRAERERLVARIAALEEESRELAGLTGEVENRLNGAIHEIRQVLSRH